MICDESMLNDWTTDDG